MSQKNVNKFLAGAVTATMVATAVVTPAMAASFTDIDKLSPQVKGEVAKAVELGFFQDGEKFNPGTAITRGQVALTIARKVSGAAPNDKAALKAYVDAKGLEEKVTAFVDVKKADTELYYASLIVKNAGAFTQDTLNPASNITRSQMAKVVATSFELELNEKNPVEITDIDRVTDKSYIQILASNKVTEPQNGKFNPGNNVTRSQMASFLVRAHNVGEDTTETPVTEGKLKVSSTQSTIIADGGDNTVIKFELLGDNGEVLKDANNIVLSVSTTYGKLSNNRVTIQNGVAQLTLQSEFSPRDLDAVVKAEVIEVGKGSDYADLIGKAVGQTTVKFTPTPVTADPNLVSLLYAESNQADRVTLYFDKPVSPDTFVQKTADGFYKVTADNKQIFKDTFKIDITQNQIQKDVVGVRAVPGNGKAIEVLIDTDNGGYLLDNQRVEVETLVGTVKGSQDFILTDARQPEFTKVEVKDLRTLELTFSESYASGNFKIDGVLEGVSGVAGVNEFTVIPGKFNAKTGVDNRHTAKVELGKVLKDGKEVRNYFKAGTHSVTVNQLKDWAGMTDKANVSTSQTLDFNVLADESVAKAEVTVASPEQFHVAFDKFVEVHYSGDLNKMFNDAFKVYDDKAKKWVKVSEFEAFKSSKDLSELLTVSGNEGNGKEYVVELTEDWTQIMANANDVYYNYKFAFDFDKDVFENVGNGKLSPAMTLEMNYNGSPLNSADNKSPEIVGITATNNQSVYHVEMNEPVKIPLKDNAGDTLATNQPNLSPVLAEFQGVNKDGKAVVIKAEVVDYITSDDKHFSVKTSDQEKLQDLVNAGYGENWKVVIKSISDDIGNTAATLTKDFVVKAEKKYEGFQIVSSDNKLNGDVIAYDATKPGEKDRIEITFTKAVHLSGVNNMTSVNNWILNGTQLSTLSNVESIKAVNAFGTEEDGLEKIIITFNDDRAFGASGNVIGVNKAIESLDGTKLTGKYEVVAKTITDGQVTPDQAAAQAVVSKIKALSVADLKLEDKAKVDEAQAAYDALTPAQKNLVTAADKATLDAAVAKIAELEKGEETVEGKTLADLKFEIKEESITGQTSVLLNKDNFPAEFEGKTLSVVINDEEFTFELNPADKDKKVYRIRVNTKDIKGQDLSSLVVNAK